MQAAINSKKQKSKNNNFHRAYTEAMTSTQLITEGCCQLKWIAEEENKPITHCLYLKVYLVF